MAADGADRRELLSRVSAVGEHVITGISRSSSRVHEAVARQVEESPMNPTYVAKARAVLLFDMTKTACFLGRAKGTGMIIARLPTDHPTLIRWSAPCFVNVSLTSFGLLSFGRSSTSTFVACMTRDVAQQLAAGPIGVTGLDAAVLLGSRVADRFDIVTAACASGLSGAVGVAKISGTMLDVSLARGSISVDVGRNTKVYGGSDVRTILSGATQPPAELQPVYAQLSTIVHQAEPAAQAGPARVSASLERFSTGTDHESVMVLDTGRVVGTENGS